MKRAPRRTPRSPGLWPLLTVALPPALFTLYTLFALFAFLLLFFLPANTTADATLMPRLHLNTTAGVVNEPLLLALVDATNTSDYRIAVQHDGATSVYTGAINTTLAYTPVAEGVYTFSLERKSTRTVVDTVTVTILDPGLVEPLPDAAYSNRLVATDKNVYTFGEPVTIWVNYKQGSFALRIVTPTTVYRYLGEPGNAIAFRPSEVGDHLIQFLDDGHLVEEKRFSVVAAAPSVPDAVIEYLPLTNIAYEVVDHARNRVAAQVKIRKEGVIVQSSIDPAQRYDVEIIPASGGVTSIRLRGLKFSNSLDLGFEHVDPKLNLNESGSLAAFALDPSRLDFLDGEMTLVPPSNADTLYKCVDYDFASQRCNGEMAVIATFTPGTTLTVPFNRLDPLYSFYSSAIACSCSYTSPKVNTGTITCNTYCGVTINAPGSTAESGFIERIQYVAALTITPDACTIENGDHEGDFDHDQTQGNGNEQNIGTSAAVASTTLTWTASGLPSTGSTSFNDLDCNNWPTTCTNYYVYLKAYATFYANGKSTQSPAISLSLTSLNVTWNYTAYGNVTVTLSSPAYGAKRNSLLNVPFVFTPNTTAASFQWCRLYTNESGWNPVANITSVTKNAANTISYNFTSDGNYLWNVQCNDSDGQSKSGSTNYPLRLDTLAPQIFNESPEDYSVETGSTVTFSYNVTDALSDVANCSLYVNGSLVETDTSITEGTSQSFIRGFTQNGLYEWYVRCSDEAGNQNATPTLHFTVNRTPVVYTGYWYETSSANCAGTGDCNIGLAQTTDGGTNSKTVTLPGTGFINLLNATSDYLGGNGAYIPSTATIYFSAYFSSEADAGTPFLTWKLYALRNNGTETPICQFGDDAGNGRAIPNGGDAQGSCSPASAIRLYGNDRLKLVMNVKNTHGTQPSTFVHQWDVDTSYVNIVPFQTIGDLTVALVSPTTDVTIAQNEAFSMTCQATCAYGYCVNTNVYAQQNTGAGAWSSIGAAGNLVLNGTETNPHNLGNLIGNPESNSTNTTFVIMGSIASVNNIRCIATDVFETATGATTRQVTVGDSTAPNINLTNPPDETYTKNTTVRLTYRVADAGGIANCSLYVNGLFNKTNSTPVTNPGTNQFTLAFASGISSDFNWTVRCYDTGGYLGNASQTWDVHVDTKAPNVTLNTPVPDHVFDYSTVTFNWTAYDNRAEALSCQLFVDSTPRGAPLSSLPGAWVNATVASLSVGRHNWSVTCTDLATNSNSSETRWFNVTDIPPTVTLKAPPSNSYDSDGDFTLYYNASDNEGFQKCDLYFNGVFNKTNSTPIVNNALNSFTMAGVPEGNHSWTVNCTDTTGYTDQYSPAWRIIVDLNAPTVGLISPKNTQLASGSYSFQFQMNDTMSYNATCALKYNTSLASTTLTGINAIRLLTTSRPVTNVPDGVYSWNVSCRDKANHTGSSAPAAFNVSQTPTVALGTPAPNAYRSGALVNFTYTPTDNDGFTNCSVRLLTGPVTGDYLNASPIVNGALNWRTIAALPAGTYTWTVRCYDNGTFLKSFQPASRFLFIDNAKPTLALNYPVDDQVNSSSVNFNWTADDDQDLTMSCDLWVDGARNRTGISSPAKTPVNFTVGGFLNGPHNWTVNCTDDAGNWNMSDWANFTVFVPPTVNLTFPDPDAYVNYYLDLTFQYIPVSNGALANCTLFLDGLENTTDPAPSDGAYNFFFANYTVDDEGPHTWAVRCYDAAGIPGWSENRTFTIDLYAPNITLTTPGDLSIVDWNNVTFSFTAYDTWSPNLTCNVTIDTLNERENIVVNESQPYAFWKLYPDYSYLWNVTCIDLAGNANMSATWNFTVEAPPRVTLLSPTDFETLNVSDLTLIYLPEDPYGIAACNLTINDGWYNDTDNSIAENQNNNFPVFALPDGHYNWTVSCRDTDDNWQASNYSHFTIDTKAPNITLHDPDSAAQFTVNDDVLFNWSASDAVDTNLTCNLTVDNTVEGLNLPVLVDQPYDLTVFDFGDDHHFWNVTCRDDARHVNTSETRNFTMNITPNVSLLSPPTGTWLSNVSVTYLVNVSDNDGFSNCTLFLNGSPSTVDSSITNTAVNAIVNASMPEGVFNWTVNCIDSGAFHNAYAPATRLLYVDRTGPTVIMHNPPDGNLTANSTVFFNFTVTDNLSPNVTCELTIDGGWYNETYAQVAVGTTLNETISGLSSGLHWWNVTCVDVAGNANTSFTWNFTVPQPDLLITTGNITFSNSSPIENQTITLFANVYNIGSSAAGAFNVSFYRGDPDAGGVQIGTNQPIAGLELGENMTVSVAYTTIIGPNNLYVIVDPPYATNGSIDESNETNNKAFRTIIVGFYTVFSGETDNTLRVTNAALTPVWTWNVSNATGTNILIADVDSALNFLQLHPLGLDAGNASAFDDFAELDAQFGATSYSDNINATWTSADAPKETRDYRIFRRDVLNVPIVNSTNTSSFKTGILWDAGDGGAEYNGSQDVVFITQVNESMAGYLGTYDYEAKIPAPLREYAGATASVVFYTELT